jgi:hypothetical protein
MVGYNGLATKETGEPDHAANSGGKSVWWTWTAPANARVTLDTIGSSFDTLLAVYTGNPVSNLALVATNDDRGEDRSSSLRFNSQGTNDLSNCSGRMERRQRLHLVKAPGLAGF